MDMIPPAELTSNEPLMHFSLGDNLQLHRASMQATDVTGLGQSWPIAERFDARFDTEVGGQIMVLPEPIVSTHQRQMLFPVSMEDFAAFTTQERSAAVVDYANGGSVYTLEQAEALGAEFAPAVARLRERIIAYRELRAGFGVTRDQQFELNMGRACQM